ncbi:N-6 DNA methylase [Streptomyces thermocarboxydus]
MRAPPTRRPAPPVLHPRALIDAIVEVTRPTPDDIIADPACGTGGFLIAAHSYLRKHHIKGLSREAHRAPTGRPHPWQRTRHRHRPSRRDEHAAPRHRHQRRPQPRHGRRRPC